ncbi:MAG: HAMP domain-containing histidine kinase [Candidatus Thorarchaeota archaeon]|nr:MAG: HAMP domain-containing histidine kinase [Candidatus Thorarchaeota archaeon]
MSEKAEYANSSRLKHLGIALLDLPKRITEPSKSITDEGERRKARFLSIALFSATTVFPILQITSEVTMGFPYYSGASVILAVFYLLSRTKHIRLASVLPIIFLASFPFLILISNPVWISLNLMFQILTWPVLAVLVGSQLLSKEKEGILIVSMNIGLIVICMFHSVIVFSDAIEFITVSFAIQALLWFTNWTSEYYTMKIEQNNRIIETRRRELEIYTSLLRHDLANDIQMVLGGLELSQMTIDEPKKHLSFIESTLAAAERMKSLIQVFSVSEDDLDKDFVTVLELICQRAEIAFNGLLVNVNIDDSIRDRQFSYSKLTAMAFENLLRNTAQHAGETPTIQITISETNNHLDIVFEDDGPGVSEEIRKQLFGKGVTTGSKGGGLGLYLTRAIIESEGGSIDLVDTGRPGCCFHIQLPQNYSH